MHGVMRHIRRLATTVAVDGLGDAQLLESFLAHRDEAAFAALVRRHGPMVLGVCRRVLRHAQDAEDAFQATFLVLARKASSLRSRHLLGNWLYGVAHRTAMKARAMSTKRRERERRVVRPGAAVESPWEELLEHLDAELSHLPDQFRVPIILCELEGKSRREAARLLGWPEGTLSSRLARGRKLLAGRLARHRATFPIGTLLATGLAGQASACVPPSLLAAATQAGVWAAAGRSFEVGMVSAQVISLTEGVLKTMLLSKLKTALGIILVACILGTSGTELAYRALAAEGAAQVQRPAADADLPSGAAKAAQPEARQVQTELERLRKEIEALRRRVTQLEDERRQVFKVDEGKAEASSMVVVPVKYLTAREAARILMELVNSIKGGVSIAVDERTNAVLIRANDQATQQLQSILRRIDVPMNKSN